LGIYLFPDLSPDIDSLKAPQLPVLHSLTRQKLYSIVGLLCKRNDVNLAQVMDMLESVVPRGMFDRHLPYRTHFTDYWNT
jgi:ubiquitin carboxyl-terminal hydrolase 34